MQEHFSALPLRGIGISTEEGPGTGGAERRYCAEMTAPSSNPIDTCMLRKSPPPPWRWRTTVTPAGSRAAILLAREIWGQPDSSPTGGRGRTRTSRSGRRQRNARAASNFFFSSHFNFLFSLAGCVSTRQRSAGALFERAVLVIITAIGASTSLLHRDHIFLVPPPGSESGDREFGRPSRRRSGKR